MDDVSFWLLIAVNLFMAILVFYSIGKQEQDIKIIENQSQIIVSKINKNFSLVDDDLRYLEEKIKSQGNEDYSNGRT